MPINLSAQGVAPQQLLARANDVQATLREVARKRAIRGDVDVAELIAVCLSNQALIMASLAAFMARTEPQKERPRPLIDLASGIPLPPRGRIS